MKYGVVELRLEVKKGGKGGTTTLIERVLVKKRPRQ